MDCGNCNTCINCKAADAIEELSKLKWISVEERKKMTNADKIRAMTDEELAKIIMRAKYFDKFCEMLLAGVNPGFCDDDCNKCALDWLKRKAESDD